MLYNNPNTEGSLVQFKDKYENFIGGEYVPPASGEYFENVSPVTGKVFTQIARSNKEDVEKALDAAHAAKDAWGKTSPAERANILNKIADRMEENLEILAVAETWDNGKPVRETWQQIYRWLLTIFVTLQDVIRASGRLAWSKLIMIRSRITSMSRLALSHRSFPGTSQF